MRRGQFVVVSTCGPCNSCLNSFCFSTTVSLLLTFACFGLFVKNLILAHLLPQNADRATSGRIESHGDQRRLFRQSERPEWRGADSRADREPCRRHERKRRQWATRRQQPVRLAAKLPRESRTRPQSGRLAVDAA